MVPQTRFFFTDASQLGWGTKIQDGRCPNGIWTASEAAMHINILELLAVKFSLMSLLADQTNTHIRIMSDSTTVVCYINDMGGSKSIECDRLSKGIWY
jgi:ribonuclease HI